jgi:DeoR family myo-inositol catabolism operon transcriptional repressor
MRTDRLRELEEFMQHRRSATIPELCEHFNVSLNTIRRDIKELIRNGSISKVYGGIIWNQEDNIVPFTARSTVATEEKRHIGSLAAAMVEDGETIYIDSGTTSVHLLPFIAQKRNVTVVSNSLIVFNEIQKYPELNLLTTGGIYNQKTKSFVGVSAVNGLNDIRIRKAFMSATGVSIEAGATNNSLHEAEIKRSVIKHAQKVILMVDHSKLDKTAAICFCDLDQLSAFVIDRKPPERYIRYFEQNHIIVKY